MDKTHPCYAYIGVNRPMIFLRKPTGFYVAVSPFGPRRSIDCSVE